jgi:nitroreductase
MVVVVLADPDAYVVRYGQPEKAASGLGPVVSGGGGTDAWPVPYWYVDAGFAVLSLLLGAVDAGLGACFLGNFRGEEALFTSLDVPPGWRYVGAVLIGEPGGEDPPSRSLSRGQRRVDNAVHYDRWGVTGA